MARRKKRSKFRLLILVLITLLIIYYFKKEDKIIIFDCDNMEEEVLQFNIVSNSESDVDNINEYFMNGMSETDFKSVLSTKYDLIDEKKYNYINYDFDEILSYSSLEKLYSKIGNSSIAETYIIGSSVDNRNIYGIVIGKGKDIIFMDANIHAAEVSTTSVLTKFLVDLVNEYENGNEEVEKALNNVKIVAIPCINPDGYEIYNFGVESLRNKDLWVYQNKDNINFENIKSNANGVDLNRNFPTQNVGLYYKGNKLIKNTSKEKTFEKGKYFNGYTAGSEPEIKAVMSFMIKYYKDTIAYINLHSQGRVLYAGKPNLTTEFNELTNRFAKYISSYTGYKVHGLSSEEVGEGNDGSATDFMAELANGFSFSTKTGRLMSDKYIGNSATFDYKYPVVTMEITKTWSKDPIIFKDEYYNHGIKDMLFDLINNKF